MISPVTGHNVLNISFVLRTVTMKTASFFSQSCASLRCSSNYYVLRIAGQNEYIIENPIRVVGLSKAWVCVRSLTGIEVSNPTEGMEVCLLWLLCVVS